VVPSGDFSHKTTSKACSTSASENVDCIGLLCAKTLFVRSFCILKNKRRFSETPKNYKKRHSDNKSIMYSIASHTLCSGQIKRPCLDISSGIFGAQPRLGLTVHYSEYAQHAIYNNGERRRKAAF